MALNAQQKGLAPTLNTAMWAAHMTSDDLHDESWLLSYEARRLGWLPSIGVADHILGDIGFEWLRTQGVSFFQPV
jgi:hypothetical protein